MTQARSPSTLTIRAERPGDEAAIRDTVRASFAATGQVTGEIEADLVEAIRAALGFDPALSLIAELDGRIIGHLLFSPCIVQGATAITHALALAPLSVLPGYEAYRTGTRLMRDGLDAARESGHRIVIVLGHAKYYRRFGFRPANDFGIHAPWQVSPDVFQALALEPGALDGVTGVVQYPPAFDPAG